MKTIGEYTTPLITTKGEVLRGYLQITFSQFRSFRPKITFIFLTRALSSQMKATALIVLPALLLFAFLAIPEASGKVLFACNQRLIFSSGYITFHNPKGLKQVRSERVLLAAARLPSSRCTGQVWMRARKKANRLMHALHGNHTCRICNCSLVGQQFHSPPTCFRNNPLILGNGMMVHKYHYCSDHVSLWFYRRRRERRYGVYFGNKAKKIVLPHLCSESRQWHAGRPRSFQTFIAGVFWITFTTQSSNHVSDKWSRISQCVRGQEITSMPKIYFSYAS